LTSPENSSPYAGAAVAVAPKTEQGQNVNVVMDYSWTLSPKTARADVPYLELIEYKITNDVMLQQVLYTLAAAGGEVVKTYTDLQKRVSGELTKNSESTNNSQATGNSSTVTKISELLGVTDNPYAGLYDLEPTGWSYILPYFDKLNHNIGGNWSTPDGGGVIGKTIKEVTDQVGGVTQDINKVVSLLGSTTGVVDARPGTYIEQAKQYKFTAQGPSYSVQFDLYNTTSIDDVIRNWELCFLLMYNILPNRKSKTVFDPPPLYEVTIPGVRKSPVSFIRGMKVDFLGATRIMDLDVGGFENSTRTIVPDGYSITIDFEDVLPESKNFMNSLVDETQKIRVSTNAAGNAKSNSDSGATVNGITRISLGGDTINEGNLDDYRNVSDTPTPNTSNLA